MKEINDYKIGKATEFSALDIVNLKNIVVGAGEVRAFKHKRLD